MTSKNSTDNDNKISKYGFDEYNFDPVAWSNAMNDISQRGQKLMADFMKNQQSNNENIDIEQLSPDKINIDPFNIGDAFSQMTKSMMENPEDIAKAQSDLLNNYISLWQNTTKQMLGEESSDTITPAASDKRFNDEEWSENAIFNFIKQSYLLTSDFMHKTANDVDGLSAEDAKKINFHTNQFIDATAPTNFLMTNPTVIRETIDSKGENLVNGLENMLNDLEKGKGKLRISMTDANAFEVGVNIATTKGQVVFQNDLMQLIHYQPTTKDVYKTPLLIIPPWINKFYILDLKEKNSFIKWALDQGQSVFIISWINPDEKLRHKDFTDYMKQGPIAVIDAIKKTTGEKQVNIIGYCLGGTLLAATLAYLHAKNKADCVKSATYFTTMIDFDDAGDLGVFIDEKQISAIEEKMDERGYLDGSEMATTFNMLRSNDLIWSFVINNYLMGKQPFPFDLLYWNSDSTRMPATMHSFYLRNMYLENNLIKPGGITLNGVAIDLTTIKTPSFILSTYDDHIAPWMATYAAKNTYSGPVKFVLSGSGHIAGVINPPTDKMKYGYWLNNRKCKKPESWLKGATKHEGSWWPEWDKWVEKYSGGKVAARAPEDCKLKIIEPAPGSYVKQRIDQS